jgi:hypothetical protein
MLRIDPSNGAKERAMAELMKAAPSRQGPGWLRVESSPQRWSALGEGSGARDFA